MDLSNNAYFSQDHQANMLNMISGGYQYAAQNMFSPNIVNYKTLRTDKVIRYEELDSGFILRANPEMTNILRKIIRNQVSTQK